MRLLISENIPSDENENSLDNQEQKIREDVPDSGKSDDVQIDMWRYTENKSKKVTKVNIASEIRKDIENLIMYNTTDNSHFDITPFRREPVKIPETPPKKNKETKKNKPAKKAQTRKQSKPKHETVEEGSIPGDVMKRSFQNPNFFSKIFK